MNSLLIVQLQWLYAIVIWHPITVALARNLGIQPRCSSRQIGAPPNCVFVQQLSQTNTSSAHHASALNLLALRADHIFLVVSFLELLEQNVHLAGPDTRGVRGGKLILAIRAGAGAVVLEIAVVVTAASLADLRAGEGILQLVTLDESALEAHSGRVQLSDLHQGITVQHAVSSWGTLVLVLSLHVGRQVEGVVKQRTRSVDVSGGKRVEEAEKVALLDHTVLMNEAVVGVHAARKGGLGGEESDGLLVAAVLSLHDAVQNGKRAAWSGLVGGLSLGG